MVHDHEAIHPSAVSARWRLRTVLLQWRGGSVTSDDPTLSAAQELAEGPIDPGDPTDPIPRPPRPPLPPPPPPPPQLSTIVSKYQNYDMNFDASRKLNR